MDSMRHLSTSLPRTQRRQDQSDLLTDFKAAALSVTNLYKSAAAAQIQSRAAGYQDALDDLLAFLDKNNLGLMDGEGWAVRQWATGRLVDDSGPRQSVSDDEEEGSAEAVDESRNYPEAQRKQPSLPSSSGEPEQILPIRISSSEPPQPISVPTLEDFAFRSQYNYPTSGSRESPTTHGMDVDASSTTTQPSTSPTETVRVVSRPSRSRHSNHNRRGQAAISLNLGSGAGSKRKLLFPEFFDIDNPQPDNSDRKDGGSRGGKRGRHV